VRASTLTEVDALTDDQKILTAVQTAMEAPVSVLEAMFRAVYAWQESGQTGPLTEFADAAIATVEVHRSPGYDKALAGAPTGSTQRGRDPKDIFAAHGF
jgi:hypothetical protein